VVVDEGSAPTGGSPAATRLALPFATPGLAPWSLLACALAAPGLFATRTPAVLVVLHPLGRLMATVEEWEASTRSIEAEEGRWKVECGRW
jgi:hypothetical protein